MARLYLLYEVPADDLYLGEAEVEVVMEWRVGYVHVRRHSTSVVVGIVDSNLHSNNTPPRRTNENQEMHQDFELSVVVGRGLGRSATGSARGMRQPCEVSGTIQPSSDLPLTSTTPP
ncbi:hypothetical protein BJ138DRAFT_1102035 [Hygrophoropsis aurantiaca]|uniref:Uncharacterized protein n=1 Tax=Hygrophoropsis aurantiaca TaxID=72124 RepID=A0ACB8AAG1_9AGAM|nr:hypothetical protein BJ138DRAFT_1102035 [Hygrophoropsis aurantiaca]